MAYQNKALYGMVEKYSIFSYFNSASLWAETRHCRKFYQNISKISAYSLSFQNSESENDSKSNDIIKSGSYSGPYEHYNSPHKT